MPGRRPAAGVHPALLFAPHVSNNPLIYTDPSGHDGILDQIIGFLFGVIFSSPTSTDDWTESFTPVSEGIGLEINVPVEEISNFQGFDPVTADDWIEGYDPAPQDDHREGYDPAPDSGQLEVLVSKKQSIRGAPSGQGDSGGPSEGKSVTEAQRKTALQANKNSSGNYHCVWCGYENDDPSHFDIDHIVPKSQGGNTTSLNLRVLCVGCNRSAQEGWPPRPGSDWASRWPEYDFRNRRNTA